MAEDPNWGPRGIDVVQNGAELLVHGSITRSVTAALERAIDAHSNVVAIRLNSPGGRTGPAEAMAQIIKARGLDTIVQTECSSACIIPFLAGRHRWATPDARMGFHQFSLGGVSQSFSNEKVRKEMAVAGVTAGFVDRAFSTPPYSMWFPSLQNLTEAHVIDGVLSEPLGGAAFTIRAEIDSLEGRVVRQAVVRLTENPAQPYWVLAWR